MVHALMNKWLTSVVIITSLEIAQQIGPNSGFHGEFPSIALEIIVLMHVFFSK